jgi:3'(2'), 5'-bisphosphate nucleotidase
VAKAGLDAHYVLVDGLSQLTPHIAIVSEEDPASLEAPQQNNCYWLIDPLDGTKEFIHRNGDFTVNLALIEDNRPSLGFVSTHVDKTLYWGGKQLGSWRLRGSSLEPFQTQASHNPIRVVASKSHLNEDTRDFITNLGVRI